MTLLLTTWLPVEAFHALAGVILLCVAFSIARDRDHPRRIGSAAFWALLALTFLVGRKLPPPLVGGCVVALVALAATKQVGAPRRVAIDGAARLAESLRLRARLLWPPLLLALVAAGGALLLPRITWEGGRLVDPKQATTVALGLGVVAALLLALPLTRAGPRAPLRAGGRLLQELGWALILPQMLAALGGIFAKSGVGDVIAGGAKELLPDGAPLLAVVLYCGGMTLFTVLMGNAFAAFPVLTLGIGIPFIVQQYGGDPAIMGAFGMLSGYCGTLVTPMAANFNVVPAVLLELDDRHAILKVQAPFAALCWLFNVMAMGALVYR
ncbi:MAG: DUF979 domain-containing protein [Planctomycetes bacterium]|nr:DUF979 domain-containing protein [Planctomycetota bacterium]